MTVTAMSCKSIPKTYKALAYKEPGKISTEVVELETPEPKAGEVLVKLSHSGWGFLPEPVKAGQVGGHEGVGTVAKLGPGSEELGVSVGDRVGIKWIAFACGSCAPCLVGADGICEKQQVSGYSVPGTFQQYTLAPAHYVTPIPDGLPSELAAPLLCGGVTAYSALKKSGAQAGDWVVVAGAGGGLGHLALQLGGRGMGFRMIGLDMGNKEELIKICGAEVFIDISKELLGCDGQTLSKHVLAATDGKGASAVVVCSPNHTAYAQALNYLKFNGTLVCVGVPGGDPTPIANAYPHLMVAKQLRIVGSSVGSRKDAIETLEMASRGIVKTHYRLEHPHSIDEVFRTMQAGKLQGRAVLDLESEAWVV
ncbi:hypothetical protein SEUCBS139899_004203 [Sporothrix eucalyptigena]|uniref:Enoyl reductase (ER) domain-containing protein n=1 Tax=Sporothrix eucalyptigena TaxID=1812306 RepID=A0ABP0B0L8_9PEZI